MRMAQSACEVPVIMFLMKSRWPGASVKRQSQQGDGCRRFGRKRKPTDDGDIVLGSLELPEGDIDGDTTLTLGLELVKNPRILEGALAELSGFLLSGVSLVSLTSMPETRSWRGRRWEERSGPVLENFCLSAGFVCPSPALIREG